MIDITDKSFTLRVARAQAVVVAGNEKTIEAVTGNTVPKGNVTEAARAAALLAIKRTHEMLPYCHPLPVEFAHVQFSFDKNEIRIETEVKTIYRTGVEMEALHGAATAALTIYDMLKPIDKNLEISSIRLLGKSGGKSDYSDKFSKELSAVVVVISDSVSSGKKKDTAGKAVGTHLEKLEVKVAEYIVIPDELPQIQQTVKALAERGIALIALTGGTGISPRDITPEAVAPILEKELPGVMEAARWYGQERTPYAMLSRGVAGVIGKSLVVTLPGSTRGAAESMKALFPSLFHIYKVLNPEYKHEDRIAMVK